MKRLPVTLIALLSSFWTIGQQNIPNYGVVSQADLQMSPTGQDSDADACTLIRTGETAFYFTEGSDRLETNVRVRIKILKDKGVDRADIIIPFYSTEGTEAVQDISGATYFLDESGNVKTIGLDQKNIYRKSLSEEYSEINFAMPGVKKGSIIEYRYTLVSSAFTAIDPWVFQDDIPTRFSQYTITVPKYMDLNYTVHKNQAVTVKDDQVGSDLIRKFTMTDIPGLPDEPYMSGRRSYLQKVEFEVATIQWPGQLPQRFTTNWFKLKQDMLDNPEIGGQLRKPLQLPGDLLNKLRTCPTAEAKTQAVYDYVRKEMNWDGYYTRFSESIADAWAKRSGASGDINLVLVSFLRAAGLDAQAMLVSTRDHGPVSTDVPMRNQFNAIMAYVRTGEKTFVLDATDKYSPANLIPAAVLDSRGLVLEKGDPQWVDLFSPKAKFTTTVSLVANMDDQGRMKTSAAIYNIGYSRTAHLRALAAGRDKFIHACFTGVYPNLSVDSLSVANIDDDALPLAENLDCTIGMQHSGDYWFFTPNLFLGLDHNPFTDDSRFTNVDFGWTQYYRVTGSLTIPDGFTFESVPKNMQLIMQDTSIVLQRLMQAEDNKLSFRMTIDFGRPVYLGSEYAVLKEFYKKLFATLNEQAVIRKKN